MCKEKHQCPVHPKQNMHPLDKHTLSLTSNYTAREEQNEAYFWMQTPDRVPTPTLLCSLFLTVLAPII